MSAKYSTIRKMPVKRSTISVTPKHRVTHSAINKNLQRNNNRTFNFRMCAKIVPYQEFVSNKYNELDNSKCKEYGRYNCIKPY